MKVWTLIATVIVAVLTGLTSALFLRSLELVTDLRDQWPSLMLFLPMAGFISATLYQRFGRGLEHGTPLLFQEIAQPQKRLPLKMAGLVWLTSSVSHLCGASVGREGAAVPMGGCLGDNVHRRCRLPAEQRVMLMMVGVAAGFAAVFGVPWAGWIFALEVVKLQRRSLWQALPYCGLAAFAAHGTALLCGTKHTLFPTYTSSQWQMAMILGVILLGLLAGITAWLFKTLLHQVFHWGERLGPRTPYLTMVGGALVSLGILLAGNQYAGLGVGAITSSFEQSVSAWSVLIKTALTALAIGTGFKGGEVTPLMFMGSHLGSWFAQSNWLPLPLSAGVGLVAVLAGAMATPVTCAVMAGELFGWKALPWALPACWLSFQTSQWLLKLTLRELQLKARAIKALAIK